MPLQITNTVLVLENNWCSGCILTFFLTVVNCWGFHHLLPTGLVQTRYVGSIKFNLKGEGLLPNFDFLIYLNYAEIVKSHSQFKQANELSNEEMNIEWHSAMKEKDGGGWEERSRNMTMM